MKQATLTRSWENNLLWPCRSLCVLQKSSVHVPGQNRGIGEGEWQKGAHMAWGSLRWFQEPGHGKKLGEKGKYSRELLQEGLFAVPEWTGLLVCGRNGAPLLAFPTAPHDLISWASSLVSAGKRAAGTYEARLGRGLTGLSWSNIPWRSLSDIKMRKFQSKSICNIPRPSEVTLHDSLGQGLWAGQGPAEVMMLSHTAAQVQDKHTEPVSLSGNNPQLTTMQEISYTTPRDRACRKDYRLPRKSTTVHHIFNPTSLWGCSVPQLCYPLRHKTPPGLAALAGGENQPLGNHGHATRFRFWMLPTILREAKAIRQSLCWCMGSLLCSGPCCISLGLLGQLVQERWPCSDLKCRCLNAAIALHCLSRNSRSGSLGRWKSGSLSSPQRAFQIPGVGTSGSPGTARRKHRAACKTRGACAIGSGCAIKREFKNSQTFFLCSLFVSAMTRGKEQCSTDGQQWSCVTKEKSSCPKTSDWNPSRLIKGQK